MSVVPLFDVLSRSDATRAHPDHSSSLPAFIENLIADALAAHRRLAEYEQQFARPSSPDEQTELDLLRAVWRLYDRWAEEAEAVLARARPIAASQAITNLRELNDAYARVRARLSVTPEKIMLAKKQAARGDIVPGEELRHDLQARLRW